MGNIRKNDGFGLEYLHSVDSALDDIGQQIGLRLDREWGNGVVEIFVKGESVFFGMPREANMALKMMRSILALSADMEPK